MLHVFAPQRAPAGPAEEPWNTTPKRSAPPS